MADSGGGVPGNVDDGENTPSSSATERWQKAGTKVIAQQKVMQKIDDKQNEDVLRRLEFLPGTAILKLCKSNLDFGRDFRDFKTRLVILPEDYLQASFEVFLFMLAVCWLATLFNNRIILSHNRIRDIFAYNNVCVGFDSPPARYIAQPLMSLQSYLGVRYGSLDFFRLNIERKKATILKWRNIGTEKPAGGIELKHAKLVEALTEKVQNGKASFKHQEFDELQDQPGWDEIDDLQLEHFVFFGGSYWQPEQLVPHVQYYCSATMNCLFMCTMLLWPMLLIITPDAGGFGLNYHFYVYVIFVVIMYLTILVNFLEASDGPINWLSKLWVQVYGVWTVLLLCVGFVGFNGYDYERCPSDNVSMIYADNVSLYEELCHQEPVIPISIMGTLDYGWFILLVFTTPLLPYSHKLYAPYELRETKNKASDMLTGKAEVGIKVAKQTTEEAKRKASLAYHTAAPVVNATIGKAKDAARQKVSGSPREVVTAEPPAEATSSAPHQRGVEGI